MHAASHREYLIFVDLLWMYCLPMSSHLLICRHVFICCILRALL